MKQSFTEGMDAFNHWDFSLSKINTGQEFRMRERKAKGKGVISEFVPLGGRKI